MAKMNFTNSQIAFEYALYMIAASYFDKTLCKTKQTETNMLLQYREQKLDKQYHMEDLCINYMDELEKELPGGFFHQKMKVKIVRREAGLPAEILFYNKRYVLCLCGIYAGKKSEIKYVVGRKPAKKAAKEKVMKAA